MLFICTIAASHLPLDGQACQLKLPDDCSCTSPSTAPDALVSENRTHVVGYDRHEQCALGLLSAINQSIKVICNARNVVHKLESEARSLNLTQLAQVSARAGCHHYYHDFSHICLIHAKPTHYWLVSIDVTWTWLTEFGMIHESIAVLKKHLNAEAAWKLQPWIASFVTSNQRCCIYIFRMGMCPPLLRVRVKGGTWLEQKKMSSSKLLALFG